MIPDQIDEKPVIRIGQYAFAGISDMKTVHFPDSISSIGPDAFYACTGLTILTLPESLQYLEDTQLNEVIKGQVFYGKTVIMVTHDTEIASAYGKQISLNPNDPLT